MMFVNLLDLPPCHSFEEGELQEDHLDSRLTLSSRTPISTSESIISGPAATSPSTCSSALPAPPSFRPFPELSCNSTITTQQNSFDYPQAYHYLAYLTRYHQMSLPYPPLESLAYYQHPGFTSAKHHSLQYSPETHSSAPLQRPPSFFFDDSALPHQVSQVSQLAHHVATPEYQYSPQASHVLGASSSDKSPHPSAIRRCFNCGDPSHSLSACPEPHNQSLIRLTKQLFQAHRPDDQPDPARHPRLSADSPEDALARRKSLAARFCPGHVSATLREALFWESINARPDLEYLDPCRPMPWFQAMERWGYPPGYALAADDELGPLEAVLARLDECETDGAWESTGVLALHRGQSPDRASFGSGDASDDDDDDQILRLLVPGYATRLEPAPLPPDAPPSTPPPPFPDSRSLPALPGSPVPAPRRQLVRYAGGNFTSDRLPIFNGRPLACEACPSLRVLGSSSDHSPNAQQHALLSPAPSARRSPYDSPPPATARDAKGKRKRREWRNAALRFAESRVQTVTGRKYVDQDDPSRDGVGGGGGLNYDDGPSSDESGGQSRWAVGQQGGRTSDGSMDRARKGQHRWRDDRRSNWPARREPIRYDDAHTPCALPAQSYEFALAKAGYCCSDQIWPAPVVVSQPLRPPLPDVPPSPVPAPPEEGLDDMVMSEESE